MRIDVLGVGFDNLTLDEAVERALALIENRNGAYVVTPNPEIVQLCVENPDAARAVNGADIVLPDGIGVVKGAALLGTPLKGRVPGIDFALELISRLAKEGKSVFLFGARPGVAQLAAGNLARSYPGIVIAGTCNGYFNDDAPIIEIINAAKPDLLLVCLGAPKQELWMEKNKSILNVGIMAGLGGSLDVISGSAKRAPKIWQRLGLEWLYRLICDPSRIGRMMKLPRFIIDVLRVKHGR